MEFQALKMSTFKRTVRVVLSGIILFGVCPSMEASARKYKTHPRRHHRLIPAKRHVSQASSLSVLTIEVGNGKLVELSGSAENVFSADPKVAEIRPASSHSVFVFGLAAGRTNIVAVDANGQAIDHYAVRVEPSTYPANTLDNSSGKIVPMLRATATPDGLNIDGDSDNPEKAWRFSDRARGLVGKEGFVSDYSKIHGSIQVNLKIRIVEMDRSLVRELGVEWQNVNALGTSAVIGLATSSPLETLATTKSSIGFLSRFKAGSQSVTLETVVDMLARDGLVHSLAEPNLTTISGQPANFVVGGEYPVPVSSYNNTTNVSFKQYGISLAFVPTVLGDGRISLHVRPEVSALSSNGAVTLSAGNSSVQIPAITVRRADTTVEMASGQSFVLAGLMSDSTKITGQGLPWLGDIPVLGALFKSSSFQKDESELVIIATPYLVKPVNSEKELHTPDEGWTPPNDMERIFMMRQSGTDVSRRRPWQRLETGDAGFMVE
ncbi:type II and III secretion system protein family protein [Acetobacter fabarum]|uniref:type II and III secretion system protein family protein n=1 Tax=Acetobacter fabarum TaxID=483199 RepID=UPI00312B48AB